MPYYTELISRPFDKPPVFPPRKTSKPQPKEGEDVVFTFGAAGQNVFQISASNRNEITDNDRKEVRRTYDTVRVKNPDDNNQHVDVEVLTEYQARNRIDDKRYKVRFTPQAESANIEILKRNQVRTTPFEE